MDKKFIGFITAIILVVAVSGYIGSGTDDVELELFENEHISFEYPKTFKSANNSHNKPIMTVINLHNSTSNESRGFVFHVFSMIFHDSTNDNMFSIDVSRNINLNTSFDQRYINLEKAESKRSKGSKDYTLEKTEINGIPAIKETIERDNGINVISLALFHDKMDFEFVFIGDDSIKSTVDIIMSSIVINNESDY